MKKISIIIPVCNTGEYIEKCLDSIINQTIGFENIEIVCVDDASDDNSATILKKYEKKYENIKCIYYKERKSASQARKDAVLASTGKYIMFVDSDDYIELDGCENVYKAIEKNKTDIVHFNSIVENCGNLPEARIESNQKAIKPYNKKIKDNLLRACFNEGLFSFTLWNKIYNGDVVRKAVTKVEDGFFPKANDLYAAFFILKEAKSYSSCESLVYHYNLGLGQTGHSVLDLNDYIKCCASAKVFTKIANYVESLGVEKHKYEPTIKSLKNRLLNEQIGKWKNNVPDYLKVEALKEWKKAWNEYLDEIEQFSILMNRLWDDKTKFFEYFKEYFDIKPANREIKTVALYYRNIVNGGAQRVVAELCNRLSDKYKVVLVTDDCIQENEYYLNEKIERYFLPDFVSSKKNYEERAKALWDLIDKYEIDAFVNSLWLQDCASIDALCVKLHPRHPAFLTHCHSFFAVLWQLNRDVTDEYYKYYSIADGIITLSKVDQLYWAAANKNVYYIPNPCLENNINKKVELHKKKKNILWIGRIAWEKQPLQIIEIMKNIKEENPDFDCKCTIVGDGDSKIIDLMKNKIADYELEDYIEFAGFQIDVENFYKDADLMISTSKYEGWTLTLFEAASNGIPTVTYDMPWLEYYNIIDGWKTLPQRDNKAASKAIMELLSDKKYWEEMSNKIYSSFLKYKETDITSMWINVFNDIENNTHPEIPNDERLKLILMNSIIMFHNEMIVRLNNEKLALQKTKKELEEKLPDIKKKYKKIKKSSSYKVGKLVTYPFRKSKKLYKKLKKKLKKLIKITIPNMFNKNPKISIIVPVYNGEEYLYTSLRTIRDQTFKDFEVICIDDESTDNSYEILEKIASEDKRFKLLKQKHAGAGAARNLGIKHAKGEYILFLDCDDIFEKKLCEKIYNKAKYNKVDILLFGGQKKDVKKNKIVTKDNMKERVGKLKKVFTPQSVNEKLFQLTSACPWTKLYNRKFILKNSLEYHNTPNSNDVFFTRTAFMRAKRLYAIEDILVTYQYNRENSLQFTKDKDPLVLYNEYMLLKDFMIKEKLYDTYKDTLKLTVMDEIQWNYNTMKTLESKEIIKDYVRKHIVEDFELDDISEENEKMFEMYSKFKEKFLDE